jgi:mono/diheme cytochrome c family protein
MEEVMTRMLNSHRFGQVVPRVGPLLPVLSCVALFLVLFSGCQGKPGEAGGADQTARVGQSAIPAGDPVARGKYVVTISGCNDCHTPLKMGPNGPEPDMTRMLSGHPEDFKLPPTPSPQPPWGFLGSITLTAFVGPWGTDFAANLTPDEETGIGSWDEALFIRALREGKIQGAGRPIMPPMPWMGIAKMTDEDLKAVFAYLRSIPPVKNHVPDYIPPAGAKGGSPR